MTRSRTSESAVETRSTTDTSVDITSNESDIDIFSDRKSSTGSAESELAIHTLLVQTPTRDLDMEVYQDPIVIANCTPVRKSLTTRQMTWY